jgi:signal transduction histidine kinase/response regulator RpfG family c-di-GMP phosphodiesterase
MQDAMQMPPFTPPDKASILIVDDRPEKVLALEAVLEDLDQTIVRANSGREALRHVLHDEFSVILLDVNMPGMDGFETAELIRQRPSSQHVPIIFITAFSDEMHAARGYSLGAVDYIQAPVLPDVLRTKVAVFVDLFRKTQQLRRQADAQRERATQLQQLAAASVAINSAMSIEQMLHTIADSARDVLGTHQSIMLYLGDPNAGRAKAAAVGSFSDRYHEWRDRPLELAAVAQTVVAKSRTPTRMSERELRAHPDWEIVSNLSIPQITGGMLAAPLCGRDGSNLGVIYVTDPNDGAFTSDDEALLMQLAQMGSIAIENTIYSQEREANRAKDEFLATLSHELRTPLNAILGWTELMKYEQMGQEVSHAFEVIDRSARAQAKLIEDLLEVSRITSGKLQIAPRQINLQPVIQAAMDAVRPSAEAKPVQLQCDLQYLPELSGDPDRLQQVIWNLLSNAVKFTPAGGTITVQAAPDADTGSIVVTVRDDGQGIRPDFLPHVFERFRQADSSSTRRHGGLGIGLTIVRHIVQLHGGTVAVASEGVGKGSAFTFTLPIQKHNTDGAIAAGTNGLAAKEPSASNGVSYELQPPTEQFRLEAVNVLLVDDDADAREVLATLLRRYDANVTTAASVAQAMERIAEQPLDLIISDISMPDEDGYSLIRRLKTHPVNGQRKIPAIALTAHARADDRERTLSAGYNEHVAKPVKPADLVAAMKRVISAAPARA